MHGSLSDDYDLAGPSLSARHRRASPPWYHAEPAFPAQLALQRSLSPLQDRRVAEVATSNQPAWLWSADGANLLWANAVGSAIFGGTTAAEDGVQRQRDSRDARAAAVARLAATLPTSGKPRLERLRGFGASFNGALTCFCSRVTVESKAAVLIAATASAGVALPLSERVRRLFTDRLEPVASFKPEGTLVYLSEAAQHLIPGTVHLATLGAEELAAAALDAGTCSGTIYSETAAIPVTALRLGGEAERLLVLALAQPRRQIARWADAEARPEPRPILQTAEPQLSTPLVMPARQNAMQALRAAAEEINALKSMLDAADRTPSASEQQSVVARSVPLVAVAAAAKTGAKTGANPTAPHQQPPMNAVAELCLRNPWWIVAASVIALAFSQGSINLYCFGLFLKPIGDELGLSRGLLSSGLFFSNVLCALATPAMGRLIDRFGSRPVMLPAIALYGLSVGALATLQTAPIAWVYVLFGLAGAFGAIQTPIIYAALICKWFDRERGLALGLAISGVGLGVMVVPQIAGYAIGAYGWRTAYMVLGAMILACAFLPVALFAREPSDSVSVPGGQRGAGSGLAGLTLAETLTRWRFWSLSLAFLIVGIAIPGTITHVVPLLTDRGFSLREASLALSSAGGTMIAGRIVCGCCLDRFHGPSIAAISFLIPMSGIALLASGAGGFAPFFAILLIGVGMGAAIGMQTFFASRYFGLKSLGVISGTMFALFLGGTGIGPFISGVSYDAWHSYVPALTLYAALMAAAAILFLPLGPYLYVASPAKSVDSHGTAKRRGETGLVTA